MAGVSSGFAAQILLLPCDFAHSAVGPCPRAFFGLFNSSEGNEYTKVATGLRDKDVVEDPPTKSKDMEERKKKGDNYFIEQGSHKVGGRNSNSNSPFESGDDFERRLFGDVGNSADTGSFFRKLDKVEQAHGRSFNSSGDNDGRNSRFMDGQGEGFDTLSDGMDSKLKKAANTFAFTDEIKDDDYKFRPDVTFRPGTTYTLRNVRFLSNFLTEAGIIIKRSQTKISAKAQRKVAREIKTARALGLMPFTTMGTKPFIFGKTMEDKEEEFEYDTYNGATSPDLDDAGS
ncbi:hypothetical protein KFK09_027984 [Dendrobium nobile]|uniref:Small ribosomal subunit protein bS18c n=1 Tax=Dendrobium nobile TaxID=94219 RepID=A0A8T3A1X4_DENNO|nr:hypothetical protein KFK09_027984 [Dendrobium nobile]